ncbi:MAG TPA: cytochrome P450 [Novosphingobium sp.]|nr:cytochrome P450 [Novosphingobium sp.]
MASIGTLAVRPHVPPSLVYDFDIELDPTLKGHPHAGLSRLQDNAPEVFYSPRYGGNWLVRSYGLIHEIMQDPELFASGGFEHDLIPIHANPPEHRQYRQVMLQAFSPKRVNAMLPTVRNMAVELIDAVASRGACEFVRDVAEPMPVIVFMRMLGLPLELMAELRRLVIKAFSASDPKVRATVFNEQLAIFDPIIRERIDQPQDDMLSAIIAAEIDGRKPTFEEVQGYLLLLANAGLDTVVNAMSFAVWHLAENPELQTRLRQQPDLIPAAVEEFLRRYAPSTISRYLTRDACFHGVEMKAGERVVLLLPAGNLDAMVYPDPCSVVLDREMPALTFGTGIHRCLGSHLARLELRTMIAEWLDRIPDFRLADDIPPQAHAGMVYMVDSLHLRWTANSETL